MIDCIKITEIGKNCGLNRTDVRVILLTVIIITRRNEA